LADTGDPCGVDVVELGEGTGGCAGVGEGGVADGRSAELSGDAFAQDADDEVRQAPGDGGHRWWCWGWSQEVKGPVRGG